MKNLEKVIPRKWQKEALLRINKISKKEGKNTFLISAAPGSGKTIYLFMEFQRMKERGEVNKIIVVCPSKEIQKQIHSTAKTIFNINLTFCIHPSDFIGKRSSDGLVVTYQHIMNRHEDLRLYTAHHKVLVVADEYHHVAEHQTWGMTFKNAFDEKVALIGLTGTPWREKKNGTIPYVKYKNGIVVPDFEYTMKEAINDKVCINCEFWGIETSNIIAKNGEEEKKEYKDLQEMKADGCKDVYGKMVRSQKALLSLFEKADKELNRVRMINPEAGGLAVLPDIKTAEKFRDMIREETGVSYPLVVSTSSYAHAEIENFRRSTNIKWLISVAMITEGVDIKRLQVCMYAGVSKTLLYILQLFTRSIRITPAKLASKLNASFFYMKDYSKLDKVIENINKDFTLPVTNKKTISISRAIKIISRTKDAVIIKKVLSLAGLEFLTDDNPKNILALINAQVKDEVKEIFEENGIKIEDPEKNYCFDYKNCPLSDYCGMSPTKIIKTDQIPDECPLKSKEDFYDRIINLESELETIQLYQKLYGKEISQKALALSELSMFEHLPISDICHIVAHVDDIEGIELEQEKMLSTKEFEKITNKIKRINSL